MTKQTTPAGPESGDDLEAAAAGLDDEDEATDDSVRRIASLCGGVGFSCSACPAE